MISPKWPDHVLVFNPLMLIDILDNDKIRLDLKYLLS